MRPHSVIVPPPTLDDDLGFSQAVEDFTIEQFIPQARVEALDIAILPRTSWRDVGGLGSDRMDPILNGLGDEFGPIVRADMLWHPAQDKETR